ncbi:MAG: L,D-transpeptidase family protein [Planctomycetota bacterium]
MKWVLAIVVLGVALVAVGLSPIGHRAKLVVFGKHTIEQRLAEFGPDARTQWQRELASYPPRAVTFYVVKDTRELHVMVDGSTVRTIPITAASGTAGPKLRRGDKQVPEGIYGIESLNPNSRFHLALRVDYPNAADVEQAKRDGRTDLGGDIMIHGGASSIGCIAVGDAAATDLFVLAADVGLENITLLIVPTDVRDTLPQDDRPWVVQRYADVQAVLERDSIER